MCNEPKAGAHTKKGLQKFLDTAAAEGLVLPIAIAIFDSDGFLVREFFIDSKKKIVLGATDDATATSISYPLELVALDANDKMLRQTIEQHVELVN